VGTTPLVQPEQRVHKITKKFHKPAEANLFSHSDQQQSMGQDDAIKGYL